MHAIISELDLNTSKIVRDIWLKLYEKCGLTSIFDIPTPHLTWFVAEEFNLAQIKTPLDQIVTNQQPFDLHTFGVGIFTGESPVLYLPMVKSLEMIHLHCEIWQKMTPFSKKRKSYYSPRLWVPHITLALRDLTRENLDCAVNTVGFDPIELYVTIDNLIAAEFKELNPSRLLDRFDFSHSEG
jgi:2'-5' RNA ligase